MNYITKLTPGAQHIITDAAREIRSWKQLCSICCLLPTSLLISLVWMLQLPFLFPLDESSVASLLQTLITGHYCSLWDHRWMRHPNPSQISQK